MASLLVFTFSNSCISLIFGEKETLLGEGDEFYEPPPGDKSDVEFGLMMERNVGLLIGYFFRIGLSDVIA